jgi:hypothetical protein
MYDRDKNKLVIFSNILRPFISLNKEKYVFSGIVRNLVMMILEILTQ